MHKLRLNKWTRRMRKKINKISHYGKQPSPENRLGSLSGVKEDQVGTLSARRWQELFSAKSWTFTLEA